MDRCRKHPLKRALRCDKTVLAGLAATLRLYRDPDRLEQRLPTLRLLARPVAAIAALARTLAPELERRLAGRASVTVIDCASQIGSGAQPVAVLPSAGLALSPARPSGRAVTALAAWLRARPVPVIGRVAEGRVVLDLRCLEDGGDLLAQFEGNAP